MAQNISPSQIEQVTSKKFNLLSIEWTYITQPELILYTDLHVNTHFWYTHIHTNLHCVSKNIKFNNRDYKSTRNFSQSNQYYNINMDVSFIVKLYTFSSLKLPPPPTLIIISLCEVYESNGMWRKVFLPCLKGCHGCITFE